MSDCKSYVSKEDLQALKESQQHIEHVARSRNAAGEKALQVTGSIRGENVTNRTLDGLEDLYTSSITEFEARGENALRSVGWVTLDSFQQGAEITERNQILRDETNGEYYRWDGNLPKTVPVGSTPESAGGVGMGAWVSVGDASLRSDLSKSTGAELITTLSGKTVQKEIDDINIEVSSFNEKRSVFFQFKQQRNFNNNMFGQLQEAQDGIFHYAPTVTVLPSGRIISVYTVKKGKAIDPGQDATPMYLQCAISDDDGETWAKKDLVNKGAGYATSESVLVHSKVDGNLYCFYTSMKGATGWGKSEQGFDENNTSQIEYVFSLDNGKTWSDPVNITEEVKPASAFFCSIAPTQCGYMKDKLIIPFYYLKDRNSGITECYITLDANRIADFGEVVRDEYQDDTPGRSGGEIGFGNFSSGELFAIERAFDDTTKSFRIAQQKLLVKDHNTDKWIVKGQFATSDCQASFIRVGLDYGFDKDYLFVVAPIGITGQLDGRQNMRIFDCSDDFSNPKDLALIAVQANIAAEYSSTQLLPTGAFISLWHGRQYTIQSSLYTINRKIAGRYLSMPSHTGYKIIDTGSGNYSYDLFDGELVKNKKSSGFSEYTNGTFHNTNSVKVKTITEKLVELNADEAGMFIFNIGSDSSAIGEIKGGYIGMVITLMVTSSAVAVELVREKSGVPPARRVMFSDSVDGNKYKMTGGTGVRSSVVKLTKTEFGWYLDRPANAS